jgi:hypothetical protein
MTYEGILNIACIFQIVPEKKISKDHTLANFHFFFTFLKNSNFIANLHTGLKFYITQYLKIFLQEYIVIIAIHN